MGKSIKSIDELSNEELERCRQRASSRGYKLQRALDFLQLPTLLMGGAVLFFTPVSVALGMFSLACSFMIGMNDEYVRELPRRMSWPYREALLERESKRNTGTTVTDPVTVAEPAPVPAADPATEQETQHIRVMRPLVLGVRRRAFNATAAADEAYWWRTKMINTERLPSRAIRPVQKPW